MLYAAAGRIKYKRINVAHSSKITTQQHQEQKMYYTKKKK